jgi:hypothetical protein
MQRSFLCFFIFHAPCTSSSSSLTSYPAHSFCQVLRILVEDYILPSLWYYYPLISPIYVIVEFILPFDTVRSYHVARVFVCS